MYLLTAYEESYYFSRKFREILQRHFDVIPMKYTTRPRNRQLTWAYINFLQTKNLIVVPAFNIQEDEQALQQIENAFPDYHGRIESVNTSDIIHHGGGLNCIDTRFRMQSKWALCIRQWVGTVMATCGGSGVFKVEKNPTDDNKLMLTINRQPIGEWFKEQWEKFRQGLRQSVEEPRKSRGLKL